MKGMMSFAGALVAGIMLCGSADAALIPTLATIVPAPGGNIFSYNVTLTGDEGMSQSALNPANGQSYGTEFIIYDFGGYVAGSIFTSNALFSTRAEQVTPNGYGPPGFTDNPTLYNLVFTYNGPDFQTTGGPYPDRSEGVFGAQSSSFDTVIGSFGSIAVKNTGVPAPRGTAGTAAFNQGSVLVATAAIPETSTWAMMLIGFGAIGSTLRRRRVVAAAA